MINQREFQLPTELNREQLEARDLPLEGCYLVTGGPGTGKSVLALLRARRLEREESDYCFLIYNRTLKQCSLQLSSSQLTDSLKCQQWQSWFKQTYRQLFSEELVGLDWDWQHIFDKIRQLPIEKLERINQTYLIIDEGQDMPREFYHALIDMTFENIYVVADQNQQITQTNSSIEDIRSELDIELSDIITLTQNYRNNHHIASFSNSLYVDPANPPPAPPKSKIGERTPLLFNYLNFDKIIERILNVATLDKSKLIGVICPKEEIRVTYLQALKNCNSKMKQDIHIEGYHHKQEHKDDSKLRFDRGGIMVINAKSCKGLEFDIVFLADIHAYSLNKENEKNVIDRKKEFYVMATRAKERLILLKKQGMACPIDSILPNETLLKRL